MLMIKQSLIDYAEVSVASLNWKQACTFTLIQFICAKSQLEEVAAIIWGDKRE